MLTGSGQRHVLFLQGTGSLFFWRLSKSLQKVGTQTSKIQFCFSDKFFWPSKIDERFNAEFSTWGNYLSQYLTTNNVSDIVLFSDSRPYHKVAVEVANSLGVNIFVFENGYIRPNWITMELGGVNGRSPFPKSVKKIKKIAQTYQQTKQATAILPRVSPFRQHIGDTAFHAVNFWTKFYHPHYENFRRTHALKELYGWTKRVFQHRPKVKRASRDTKKLYEQSAPFFVLPLQLENDYQLLVDSDFSSVSHACDAVIASFAMHAKEKHILVIKNHPLDNNFTNWEKVIKKIALQHSISDRVVFLESAHNPTLLSKATGMVTINSTMGTSALYHDLPLCVLGNAIYKIKGLVHDGGLDSFWQSPQPPKKRLYKTFKRALIGQTQISGRFSTPDLDANIYTKCMTKILATSYKPAGLSTISKGSLQNSQAYAILKKIDGPFPAE